MRMLTSALVLLTLATPASAGPVTFNPVTFSIDGIMSNFSTIKKADGSVVDVSLAPFTIIGITTGIDPSWAAYAAQRGPQNNAVFTATITYDFGKLGSITSLDGGEQYLEGFSDTPSGRLLGGLSFMTWAPGLVDIDQGFSIFFAPVPAAPFSLTPDPTVIGAFDVTATLPFNSRIVHGANGDSLTIAHPITGQGSIQMTHGEVRATPEPVSGLLLLVGAGAMSLMRPRH